MSKKSKWIMKKSNSEASKTISEKLELHHLTANILVNRGIDTAEAAKDFLNPDVETLLDPFLLKDMEKAVERIKKALSENEKIVVYGDYDVDGITAVSIIYLYLKAKNGNVNYYIPSRSDEGYGLNKDAVLSFKNDDVSLIITADCGITAIEDISYATSLGIDVVITDHHKCKDVLPEAWAVINPKRMDCSYPFKELSGVGVAFKVVSALEGVKNSGALLDLYGDLLCLGTIADIVTLTEENRVFVSHGLKLLANPGNMGLKALIKETGLAGKNLTSSHVGFIIAPRINAVGRLGNALDAVRLFTTDDQKTADELASMLCNENIRRQTIEQEILSEACSKIDRDKINNNDMVIVLASDKWHHGVIGIVASRITEKYGKPCILIAIDNEEAKGSCRGVLGFNMYNALSHCEDLLTKFGGHELAAGLTIESKNIEALRVKINAFAKTTYPIKFFVEEIQYDAKITDKDITVEFTDELEKIQPCGMGNAVPQFLIEKMKIEHLTYFGDEKHIRLRFSRKSFSIMVIGFGMGTNESIRMLQNGDIVNAIVTPYTNEYKNKKYAALKLKDIKLV